MLASSVCKDSGLLWQNGERHMLARDLLEMANPKCSELWYLNDVNCVQYSSSSSMEATEPDWILFTNGGFLGST